MYMFEYSSGSEYDVNSLTQNALLVAAQNYDYPSAGPIIYQNEFLLITEIIKIM